MSGRRANSASSAVGNGSGELMVAQPQQEVAQVGGRAEHRGAVVGGAVVLRAEQRGQRLVALDRLLSGVIERGDAPMRVRPDADEVPVELQQRRDDARVAVRRRSGRCGWPRPW